MRDLYELNINRDLNYDEPIDAHTILSRERKTIENRFAGKVAIVTGGTAGIGLAIVEELLKEGAKVAFTGRDPETGKAISEELTAMGLTDFLYIQADMSKEEDCRMTVDKTVEAFGRLDHLVNNAFPFIMVGRNFTRDDWMRIFEGGLMAYARMMSFASYEMLKVGGGSMVNISSISAHITQGNWTYNSMKGGVNMLSKSAAMDFARDNIRVNIVSPAHIWTRRTMRPGTSFSSASNEKRRESVKYTAKGYMLNRGGEPVECAAATLFLLSDDASYITATEFMVDGGFIALGSQGALSKSYRDERVYGIEPSHGNGYSTTKPGSIPASYYPALYPEDTKE
ncbi:MAG: SDR family oxidoreductase [Clostridiales bacterium]|nr:SDR family oxidoreductase [Clostridiales bacterium]